MEKSRRTIHASVREYAAEKRRSEEVHPKAEELAAYHEGELGEEDRERIREHLAFCGECSRLVLDLAHFSELEPPSEEYRLSREDVEAGQRDLRARIGIPEPAKLLEFTPRQDPKTVATERRTVIPLWYHAVAASLLAATVGLALWSATLSRGPVNVNQQVEDLLPWDEHFRGSANPEALPVYSEGDLVLMLTFVDDVVSYPAYRLEIHDQETQERVGVLDGLVLHEGGHFTFSFPSELRDPGRSFRLELFGVDGADSVPLAEYRFSFESASGDP